MLFVIIIWVICNLQLKIVSIVIFINLLPSNPIQINYLPFGTTTIILELQISREFGLEIHLGLMELQSQSAGRFRS